MIKVEYYGHCFCLITTSSELRVATDPYSTGSVDYPLVSNVKADVVTISHDHGDHNNAKAISGNPVVLREVQEKEIQGVSFKGISTYHDIRRGKIMGPNIIWVINDGRLSVVHTGDLGHLLTFKQIEEIGKVDVLLLNVGGTYMISPEQATRLMDMLRARIVIPIHYFTPFTPFGVAPLYEFLKDKGREEVKTIGGGHVNFLEIDEKDLPDQTLIMPILYAFQATAKSRK